MMNAYMFGFYEPIEIDEIKWIPLYFFVHKETSFMLAVRDMELGMAIAAQTFVVRVPDALVPEHVKEDPFAEFKRNMVDPSQ